VPCWIRLHREGRGSKAVLQSLTLGLLWAVAGVVAAPIAALARRRPRYNLQVFGIGQ
jgi:ABC-type spermidine/putrescine transport system permease subunit II